MFLASAFLPAAFLTARSIPPGGSGPVVPGAHVLRDPSAAELGALISVLGAGWAIEEDVLRLQLRDPSWLLDRPLDRVLFAGTGGLEGPADLAGRRKPKLRGGSAGRPVRQVAPVLVDGIAGIYQVSDAGGDVVGVFDAGRAITPAGTVGDITAASPAAGTFVVESGARGLLFRLGTFPADGIVTCDAWGAFPDGTATEDAAAVALQLMLQDANVPSAWIDGGSFAGFGGPGEWPAGIWVGDDDETGVALVGLLLRSCGARLVPRRTGLLAAVALRGIAAGQVQVATYDTGQVIACAPRDIGPPMAPPPARIRVGHTRYYTTQATDLWSGATGLQRQALAAEWRVATAAEPAVLANWRRPSEPDLVETALTSAVAGQALADQLRDLWCVAQGRRLWDVVLPLAYALRHDIGDLVRIAYPGLPAGSVLGRIVGEQLRTADDIATIQVLA